MNCIALIMAVIYVDAAVFISVYTYYKVESGYKIMFRDGKIQDKKQMVKTMKILKIKAVLVGLFFPVTLPALAAVLAANKQE